MTHLLDTSALLAFLLHETGAERVRAIFEDSENSVAISVLSKAELWSRLRGIGREAELDREWTLHRPLFDAVIGVDETVVNTALSLRRAATGRLPTIDALIAATASAHGLILVHRDAHMCSIPPGELEQVDLAATKTP